MFEAANRGSRHGVPTDERQSCGKASRRLDNRTLRAADVRDQCLTRNEFRQHAQQPQVLIHGRGEDNQLGSADHSQVLSADVNRVCCNGSFNNLLPIDTDHHRSRLVPLDREGEGAADQPKSNNPDPVEDRRGLVLGAGNNRERLGHERESPALVMLNEPDMPAYDIRERAFNFSCDIVRFYQYLLEETRTPRRVADQLLDAATSVGANLEEADVAHSKPDFLAKNSISLKEGREARYWLRLIRACKLAPESRLDPLIQECAELVRIITAIRKNAGHRKT